MGPFSGGGGGGVGGVVGEGVGSVRMVMEECPPDGLVTQSLINTMYNAKRLLNICRLHTTHVHALCGTPQNNGKDI